MEARLIQLLWLLGWQYAVDPAYCKLYGANGLCCPNRKTIYQQESWNTDSYWKSVLWHEATHAAQYEFWGKWKALGFKPNYKGHKDWLLDRVCYSRSFNDVEREARYVQYSTDNQKILLEFFEKLASGKCVPAETYSVILKSEIEVQKPKLTWKHAAAVTGYLYVVSYLLLIASSNPTKLQYVDSGTPECTYSQLDAGDCVSEDNPWD